MRFKSFLTFIIAVAFALSVPTLGVAKPGKGNGGDKGNGNDKSQRDDKRGNGNGKANGHANGRGNGHQREDGTIEDGLSEDVAGAEDEVADPALPARGRNHVARGVVVSVAGNVVTVRVTSGPGGTNHAGLGWRGQEITFDVSAARLHLRDANLDGTVDLTDLQVGARVQVQAFLAPGSAQPYPARRLTSVWKLTPTTQPAPETGTETEGGDDTAVTAP